MRPLLLSVLLLLAPAVQGCPPSGDDDDSAGDDDDSAGDDDDDATGDDDDDATGDDDDDATADELTAEVTITRAVCLATGAPRAELAGELAVHNPTAAQVDLAGRVDATVWRDGETLVAEFEADVDGMMRSIAAGGSMTVTWSTPGAIIGPDCGGPYTVSLALALSGGGEVVGVSDPFVIKGM